ncbi:hypothetical protein THAOC_10782 [Thalassiosira oceanica]|uniref:Kinetochore protein NDC80 n=1 Tax=Thalassiosira oceanica TaxID=159749 RepID=K0SRQ4_THAOC|nr:hypothetical protein THAOC_10782 [Thalassiosira oceanica]|eukprot:EJK68080.1 hypothetical protein THAOC_10782 [Thalassiosira oceanica]
MVNYLRSTGYPDSSSLSVRQLLGGPSGRDFQNIMTFLMRRVDPTFARTSSPGGRSAARTDEGHIKFEDEITMAFRCLGYPFPISKTGLVAVGSPTHWPTLVAAIDWLVDLLVIKDGEDELEWGPGEADMSEDELATLGGSTDRVEMQFHSFLRKSMVAFLRDDNDECAELEGRLLDEFQRDCEKVEAYVTGFDGECERMAEEIEGLNAEVDGLAEAHQKQEECAANIEKFLAVIETLREHNAELSDRVDTLTIEKATMEGEMGDLSEKIERLKTTIGSQELNQEDVRRMEREKARTEEQSARQRKVLDGVVAALDEIKERLAACHEMLERRAGEYNATAVELELVPKTSRHAGGLDLEVRPDRSRAGQTATSLLGGVDVRGTAVPLVRKLARSYEGEAAEKREAIAEAKDRIEATEGVREEIKEEVETIKHEIALRDEECDSAREKLESDILDKKGEVERLNDKISSLSDPGGVEATLARLDAEAVELEERRRKESETNRLKKKAVADEVRRAVEAAQEYRERKAARLREMNDYVARKVEEARKLKLLDS